MYDNLYEVPSNRRAQETDIVYPFRISKFAIYWKLPSLCPLWISRRVVHAGFGTAFNQLWIVEELKRLFCTLPLLHQNWYVEQFSHLNRGPAHISQFLHYSCKQKGRQSVETETMVTVAVICLFLGLLLLLSFIRICRPQGQVVSQQLHDQGTIFVCIFR